MMAAKAKTPVRVGSRRLELSNLDKVFYPEVGFTKGNVIDYYRAVAPVLIPHLRDRALTLKRYPDGVTGSFFYEKRCPPHRPDWIKTVSVRRKRDNKDVEYCVLNNEASLVWAANLGNLELHTSLARAKDVGRPTSVVFDLDPGPGTSVVECADVAIWIEKLCRDLGLESFVKTSGSKGLQLYVPLNTKTGFDETGSFAHSLALLIEDEHPDAVVTRMAKELRTDKVLIDWSQNDDHKTTAAVYSLRAMDEPTASTPVTWSEIRRAAKDRDPAALRFNCDELVQRIAKHGDLFEPVRTLKQKLPNLPPRSKNG